MKITSDILNGAVRHDQKCQRMVYEAFKNEMFQVCRRYATDEFNAKDMFQEGFIKVFKDLHQFDARKGALGAWMRKVMVNTCLQNIRKNKRWKKTVEITPVLGEDMASVDAILHDLALKDIYGLLKNMPEGYRMVFNLYLIEGYSHKEIADNLGCTESTSKSQLYKAKNWMRLKLIELDPTIGYKYGPKVAQG